MPEQPAGRTGKLRILVVEDEVLVADYISDIVEEAGHEVVAVAPSGEQALDYLERNGIDLAILDIKLKGRLTGIDVAASTCRCSIPHVYISGSGDPTTLKAARETNPLDFLQKPLDPRRLQGLLNRIASSLSTAPGTNGD
jgi:CheY-like chemotaxis protein